MNKTILSFAAFMACLCALGANVYTNSFVKDGVTYVQRGGLTVKDYVVTNVVGGIGGGNVESVNGQTGVVVISEVNSATNWIDKPSWIEDNYATLANEANYSTEAGHVPWNGINEKPDWIGNTKPTYTANEVGALPITGGTLRSDKVDIGEGTELNIIGSYGKYEPEEFIPEGGDVEIKGGDSDKGGSIEIYGGYGNGGNLKIYPPNGLLGNDYGIEIKPYGGVVGVGGFIKVNGTNVMDAIAAVDSKVENAVLPTNPAFSNAVLAVGLNIDTNSVAVLNDIAETFGGFPIEGTATTVGGLLAALAAAVAWLKKNKVGSFASVGGASATVENGVAKLESFFTESNSLLNGRLVYERNATGLKDRAFNALTFDGTEYNLSTALAAVTPTASGQPRDLLIVATATAATTISFTAGTIKGDKPTIDGSGTWLITLTEYASGVWYCRQIKMEDAA